MCCLTFLVVFLIVKTHIVFNNILFQLRVSPDIGEHIWRARVCHVVVYEGGRGRWHSCVAASDGRCMAVYLPVYCVWASCLWLGKLLNDFCNVICVKLHFFLIIEFYTFCHWSHANISIVVHVDEFNTVLIAMRYQEIGPKLLCSFLLAFSCV